MNIAIINIPIKATWLGEGQWITVPPQGYGGIQWVVKNIIDGLLFYEHKIFLLGAPGSKSSHPELEVIDAGDSEDIINWLKQNQKKYDLIHEHSNMFKLDKLGINKPFINTHHFTGVPNNPMNTVYLSNAQAACIQKENSPVIRIPVNPSNYIFSEKKDDYYLFMGRVSPWKGVLEAASFCSILGSKLVIAGPSWEKEYFKEIISKYQNYVTYVGEVKGEQRLNLLSSAKAILVLSQPILGPWGESWCEPGATVVSEASVSGTPVISTGNGCLAEITPLVGSLVPTGILKHSELVRKSIEDLPKPNVLRKTAISEWGYKKIAKEYIDLYIKVINGKIWN